MVNVGRRMKKTTKDRIASSFLNYLKNNGSCTAKRFVVSDSVRKYNLTRLQFAMLFREYKEVEPYKSLIDSDSRNKMGSTVYNYKGE